MTEIPRDRYLRPMIIPLGGSPDDEHVSYTRPSSIAKLLDDTSALTAWKSRMAAVGLARSPHLVDRIASLSAKHVDPVREARGDLNKLVSQASDAAGMMAAADIGTSLHTLTEVVDTTGDLSQIPERWRDHLDAYQRAMKPVDVLAMEQFVVNDDYQVAGTFDRLVRLPDGRVVVADIKTGRSDPQYPTAVAIQLAAYSGGAFYDPETGERTVVHEDLDPTVGVLIHMPAALGASCTLYQVDLVPGRELLDLACRVRGARRIRAHELVVELDTDNERGNHE